MNKSKGYFLIFAMSFFSILSFAQTADEIIDGYYEAIGGKDAWLKVENMVFNASVNQQGMEIPLEIYRAKDGKSYTKISLQGMSMMQGVYDGESLWNTNMQTMKPEKATTEQTENFKNAMAEFPDALLEYKKLGYTAELVGTESFDGTEAHKLKLTKKPMTKDGAQVDNVEFYFFDVESMVLLGSESVITDPGPMKGKTSQTKLSEYAEVDGLFMPFSMSQGIKDGPSQAIKLSEIQVNVEIDEKIMMFPSGKPMSAPSSQPSATTKPSAPKAPTTAPTSQPSGNHK